MSQVSYPQWLLKQIQGIAPQVSGQYAAQLLWDRGVREASSVTAFLDMDAYEPTGPDAFGQEMEWAIARLEQARSQNEQVTIWGDFDADGVTATSVLWEGLGQFLSSEQLDYVIPNRLTDSHGLNEHGIQKLHEQGTQLIVTCDTGCTNLAEIAIAHQLGIDVIVTDHHTLPNTRPPVVALLNPRTFAGDHPLATLSGVAVAYKLVEAWYQFAPEVPRQPLSELLDLVAIGLIADLVELKQDCRYLAQRGLQTLRTRTQNPTARPGVSQLLSLCNKAGDRPTDISFGIGPRINAVSRIQGDASFCVELLTSRDPKRCQDLALETELANSRRKELQQRIKKEAIAEIEKLDLSTTEAIVIAKRQWPLGVLGLVAGEIAQTWGKPTFLMQIETDETGVDIARGSARSIRGIDLYDLMSEQSHLLTKFGGHPYAAGLSMLAENLDILTQSLNHGLRLRQSILADAQAYDLVVTVKELGHTLFKEFQLLEPYGMGNRVPRLLIKDCWFENVTHRNLRDRTGKKLRYIQALFELKDASSSTGFPGVWWEHYKEDCPKAPCDVIAELDFNNYQRRPEIRVLAVITSESDAINQSEETLEILDWRQCPEIPIPEKVLVIQHCPQSWNEWGKWVQRSRQTQQPLVLAFQPQPSLSDVETWYRFIGITKSAIGTKASIPKSFLKDSLALSETSIQQGLALIRKMGIQVSTEKKAHIRFSGEFKSSPLPSAALEAFFERVKEERFQQQYFEQISSHTIQLLASNSGQFDG